jgi:hypothetical protein
MILPNFRATEVFAGVKKSYARLIDIFEEGRRSNVAF